MKPSERGWPPRTDNSPALNTAPEIRGWRREWERRVDRALESQNSDALADLYRELSSQVPSDIASEIWLHKMSAWDSSAVTG